MIPCFTQSLTISFLHFLKCHLLWTLFLNLLCLLVLIYLQPHQTNGIYHFIPLAYQHKLQCLLFDVFIDQYSLDQFLQATEYTYFPKCICFILQIGVQDSMLIDKLQETNMENNVCHSFKKKILKLLYSNRYYHHQSYSIIMKMQHARHIVVIQYYIWWP